MTVSLRPYQLEAIDRVRASWREHRGALVVLPTGGGKTILGLSLVASAVSKGHRVLWLAHREELLEQPLRALRGVFADAAKSAGIVKADRDDAAAQVVFGSIDTLRVEKRLARYLQAGPPALVVCDEAHHTRAATWETVLAKLDEARVAVAGRPPYRLGLTATPDRADGKTLSTLWKLAFAYSIIRAFREGFLVEPTPIKVVLPGLDLGAVGGGEDWNADELGAALMDAHVVEHTVEAIRAHAPGRRTVVFTATVAQAKATAEALQASGVESRFVSGETPAEDRRRLLRAFERGDVQVLCNAQVLTEGTDIPAIDCVVMARPTRSRGLYVQCLGRGLRPSPGKADCIVLDLVGSTDEHRMIVAPVLLDELARAEAAEGTGQPRGKGPGEARPWRRVRPPQASWVRIPDVDREAYAVDCGEHGLAVVAEKGDGWMAWLVKRAKDGGRVELADQPVSKDLAIGLGEDVARQARSLTLGKADWRARPVTDAQRSMLDRFGRTLDEEATSGAAADAITAEKAKREVARAKIANRTDKMQGAA